MQLRAIRLATIALFAVASSSLSAQTIRAGFDANTLARNDDLSTGIVALGFDVNFFGLNGNSLFVNNNGNVTFDAPLGTFTPFPLTGTNRQILAPFFADVDTRNVLSGVTQYGVGTVGARAAFGVNWLNVGYFDRRADKLNSFQLVMIDRADVNAGDFDFEFNYGSMLWETGEASGGVDGLGGSCARAGWSNGAAATFELDGSAVCGALIDGGANMLSRGSNINTPGRFLFEVRNGVVVPPTVVPEPSTYAMLAMGLAGLGLAARRRRIS